jgi:hypothetical protein
LTNRGIALWAYELEQYRRSRVTVFFNAASYLWLVLRSVALLALINWGIYHADRPGFTYTHEPSFTGMFRYTAAHLYGGQISSLRPASTAAHILSTSTIVVALVILLGLILSIGLSLKATRDDSETESLVAGVRAESERIDHNFRAAYGVSATDAIERLERLKEDTAGLLAGLAKRIPTNPSPADHHDH